MHPGNPGNPGSGAISFQGGARSAEQEQGPLGLSPSFRCLINAKHGYAG